MRYSAKRQYIWSPDIAYSVGLMASDGCLSSDGRHLDLTSIDIEQLENFSNAIGRKLPISQKQNKSHIYAYRTQFSDVAYYDFLLCAGLTPAKSKTLSTINIPDQFYADFLRGLFDGDGTTYAYMDKRWRSSYMYYVGFTSASSQFLLFLRSMNSQHIGVSAGAISINAQVGTLKYAKKDAYKIASYMYYAPTLLSLSRKRLKLASFVSTDQTVIISRNARVP